MGRFWMLVIITCMLVAGCAKNGLYQGLYDGVRVRDQLATTPAERVGKPEIPNYQQYENMRKEQTK